MESIVKHKNWKFNFENNSVSFHNGSRWIKLDLSISDLFNAEDWIADYEYRQDEIEKGFNSEL